MNVIRQRANGSTWSLNLSSIQLFYSLLGCIVLMIGLLTPFVDYRATIQTSKQALEIRGEITKATADSERTFAMINEERIRETQSLHDDLRELRSDVHKLLSERAGKASRP